MEPPSAEPLNHLLVALLAIDATTIIVLAIIGLLLIVSALISGSEVAYFSLSPAQLDELKKSDRSNDKRTLALLDNPERLLATILIGNNLVNVAIIILSSLAVDKMLIGAALSGLATNLIKIGLVTFVILMAGEVLPKVYAASNGLSLARTMSRPISLLNGLFRPLSMVLLSLSSVGKRFVKNKYDLSVDTLEQALELTMDDADIEEQRILEGIVKFGNTDVKQVMTDRTAVHAVDINMDFAELVDMLTNLGHSRIPVYEETLDEIKGLLYLKDLLPYIGIQKLDWQTIIRKPFFVPESKKIDDLLIEFKEKKMHLAIVVDEYGGTSGIITLEDVIEEIVGDITDEFDDEGIVYSKISEFEYLIEGKTPLIDVYRILDIPGEDVEQAKGESDTLAGFIIEQAGKIPLKGERIQFGDMIFVVEAADKRKVRQVKVQLSRKKEENA